MMAKRKNPTRQRGVSLIEVMIAVFISAIGVLGAAALQLNALKYTDSSRMTSQASFIVYDIIDRIRANAAPGTLDQYSLANLSSAPAAGSSVREQDLKDFANNVQTLLTAGQGSIVVNESVVTVQVSWSEGRASGNDAAGVSNRGSFSVTTAVKPLTGGGL